MTAAGIVPAASTSPISESARRPHMIHREVSGVPQSCPFRLIWIEEESNSGQGAALARIMQIVMQWHDRHSPAGQPEDECGADGA